MAPSTLFQLPGSGHRTFSLMADFVRRVPAFHLDLGADRRAVAGVIRNFLDHEGWLA